MKKSEIKSIVNEALKCENNDSLPLIKEKCNHITQIEDVVIAPKVNKRPLRILKPIIFGAITASLVIGSFYLGTLDYSYLYKDKASSIHLDVNPSVEIKVNKNKVIETIANNDDGESILNNINIKGVNIKTALFAVIGSMYTLGYIDKDTNSILVSIENRSKESSLLLDDISNQILDIFKENDNIDASIIAQHLTNNEELVSLANKYNISIGKMELILKIIELSELYTEEDIEELSHLSIKELNLIYKSLIDDDNNPLDDVLSGEPNGYIDEETAITYVLDYLDIVKEDLEYINIEALYKKPKDNNHFDHEFMYLVTLKYKVTNVIERYIVDCLSGEILPEEDFDDWRDKLPDDGGHFGGPDKDDEDRPKPPDFDDEDGPDRPDIDGDKPPKPPRDGDNTDLDEGETL